MAEFGAHVTSTIGDKPTIFEVLAQQSLDNGLRSSFRYLFKVLSQNNPVKFGAVYRNFEELYTVLDFLVQYLHLKIHGASFAESFYGLKRMPMGKNRNISNRHRWLPTENFYYSLVLLVLFPYMKVRLLSFYNKVKDKEITGELEHLQENDKQLSRLYIKLYPYFHFCWEFLNLIYQVSYAVGKSPYHSPLLHMSSTQLRTLTREDQLLLEKKKNVFSKNIRWHSFPYQMFQIAVKSLAAGISVTLSTGAFFLQFLDWWYSQDNNTSLVRLPIPPPPRKWPVKFSSEECPICRKKRRNETVLSSSGFVFCYHCIYKHIQNYSCCPITGYPSTIQNLIKLYPPED